MIVTGVARFNHLGDFFLGTAVDYVVRHAVSPVLVVKQRPHRMYEKVVIATDYSQCSLKALVTVAALFPEAELHLVHAYHVPYEAWLTSDEVKGYVKEEAQEELDAFVADPQISDVIRQRLNAKLSYGEVGGAIAREIEAIGADLVAIGTHGRSGFMQAMLGSTAEELLTFVRPDTSMVRE